MGDNAVGNGGKFTFWKNSKSSAFFDEKWPEKYFLQKLSQHAAQLKSVPSISAKHLHFQSYRKERSQKYTLFAVEKIRNLNFFAKNSQEKIRRPKVWNKTDREPVVVFIQKSDESDQ